MNQNHILRDLKEVAFKMSKIYTGLESYLFGSRARGDYNNDSDWDILLLLKDNIQSEDYYEKYCLPFAEIGWKYGTQITPLFFTLENWEKEKNTLFYFNFMKEKIKL